MQYAVRSNAKEENKNIFLKSAISFSPAIATVYSIIELLSLNY